MVGIYSLGICIAKLEDSTHFLVTPLLELILQPGCRACTGCTLNDRQLEVTQALSSLPTAPNFPVEYMDIKHSENVLVKSTHMAMIFI